MCGIFGYLGKKENAAGIVIEGLKNLEYRGYDSWGIGLLTEKSGKWSITVSKKTGKIGAVKPAQFPNSRYAFGHTRWATHGGVTDNNAHPHTDCTGQFAVIHNGIIENYDVLKKNLINKGHKFRSDTDSEVAVHQIEEAYSELLTTETNIRNDKEYLFSEAVRRSFNKFTGLNAIIVIDTESKSLVAAKNGSPLVIGKGIDENLIASDAHALLPYTNNVYFMDDNRLVLMTENKITVYDCLSGKPVKPEFTELDWIQDRGNKGNFPHFMIKEIYDQPEVLETIINDSDDEIRNFAGLINKSFGTYLVGCGTAAYACLAGTYLFSKIAGKHVNFSVGSEFGYLVDFLTENSLVLALSQSGETIDVIEAVKKARAKRAKIGALVNVLGSTLYRESDYKLLLNAGLEKAVVSTKAFTAKLAYLLLIAHELNHTLADGKKELNAANKALRKVLEPANMELIRKLVKILNNKDDIYVIGRGLSYPLALETALKIKEASYIHAEGFAAGELKHGVIALIEKMTPCIVFLPNDETYGANLAGAMEMKARGGYIIGISAKPHEIFDYYLPVAGSGSAWIIPAIAIGQLLGYYLALSRGYDPDKPRNLAKSVTVK